MQDIVVVQQGHIVALDHSKALIGVAGNAVVLVQLPITDAGSEAARAFTVWPTVSSCPASTMHSSQLR